MTSLPLISRSHSHLPHSSVAVIATLPVTCGWFKSTLLNVAYPWLSGCFLLILHHVSVTFYPEPKFPIPNLSPSLSSTSVCTRIHPHTRIRRPRVDPQTAAFVYHVAFNYGPFPPHPRSLTRLPDAGLGPFPPQSPC